MPFQSEIEKIIERLLNGIWVDFSFADHAPQRMRKLYVDQMWCMQLFALA